MSACLSGQFVLIAVNLSRNESSVALEGDAALYTGLADSLTVSDAPAGLQEGTLQLPGYGIALLLRG